MNEANEVSRTETTYRIIHKLKGLVWDNFEEPTQVHDWIKWMNNASGVKDNYLVEKRVVRITCKTFTAEEFMNERSK